MCLRGIDTLSAAGLCAEVGDFRRFRHPEQLMSYLGVVPSEHSSGSKRRLGPITKSGSQHARRLLVEAAWHYRQPPRVSTTCAAARPALTRRSSRSPGRPSGDCTTCGRGWRARKATDDHRGRRRPRIGRLLLGGRHRRLNAADISLVWEAAGVRAFAPEHP